METPALNLLKHLAAHAPESVRREDLPEAIADEAIEDYCYVEGLIHRSSSGLFLSQRGRALLFTEAEAAADVHPSLSASRGQVRHAGQLRTADVTAVIDQVLIASQAARLLEDDVENFRRDRWADRTLSVQQIVADASHHHAELLAAIHRARCQLPLAAWALGATPSQPAGVYTQVWRSLSQIATETSMLGPAPHRVPTGRWHQIAAAFEPIRISLQHDPLRDGPMDRDIAGEELKLQARAAAEAIQGTANADWPGDPDRWDVLRAELLNHLARLGKVVDDGAVPVERVSGSPDSDLLIYHPDGETMPLRVSRAGGSQPGADLSRQVAERLLIWSSEVDAEYRPASWFVGKDKSALRHATDPDRKTKRVRSRNIDGVVCYSVKDVQRWLPRFIPARNAV